MFHRLKQWRRGASQEEARSCKQRGDDHLAAGRYAAAAAAYDTAIACDPAYAAAHANRSNACRELQRYDEAEADLRKAIALEPGTANFHYNLASLLLQSRRLEEAIAHLDTAVRHHPGHHAARSLMRHLMQQLCRWEGLAADTQALRHAVVADAASPESAISPFMFLELDATTPLEQQACARRWVAAEWPRALAGTQGFARHTPPPGRITLGYLSADFREHPVARLMAPVLRAHDRTRFRILAYAYGPDDGSDLRHAVRTAVDHFEDIDALSDGEAARRIHANQVDILVDLTGHTQNSRSHLLALRPAPLQLSYLGYPGTLGADCVDGLLTDRFVSPPALQPHFCERFVYLPHCFMPPNYQETETHPPTPGRVACGLPVQGFVFCGFNRTYKLNPRVFAVWMQLLQAVPQSVLWLSDCDPAAKRNLWREAEACDISPSRLLFAPRVPSVAEHLARLTHADLFLDTFPYNAHTTCSDALSAGVPVITCAGDTFPSRVAGSLLSGLGLDELISGNLDDYHALALALASDGARLAALRRRLTALRRKSPLFDVTGFTRGLEAAYTKLTASPE